MTWFLKTPVRNYCNMNEKCKTLWSAVIKSLNSSLFKGQVASSHILLAKGNCLLVLANDLVTRWRALTLAHWTSEVKILFVQPGNLLVLDGQTGLFLSPVYIPANVFICEKTDRQWSGLEYFTPHWRAKWIISVFSRVSVWKPRGYTLPKLLLSALGGGEGDVQCTSGWLGKEVMFWIQRVRNPDSAIPFSHSF